MIDVFPNTVTVNYTDYSNSRISAGWTRGLVYGLSLNSDTIAVNVALTNTEEHHELAKKYGGLGVSMPPELLEYGNTCLIASYALDGASFCDVSHQLFNSRNGEYRSPVTVPVVQSLARVTLASLNSDLSSRSGTVVYPVIGDPNERIVRPVYVKPCKSKKDK